MADTQELCPRQISINAIINGFHMKYPQTTREDIQDVMSKRPLNVGLIHRLPWEIQDQILNYLLLPFVTQGRQAGFELTADLPAADLLCREQSLSQALLNRMQYTRGLTFLTDYSITELYSSHTLAALFRADTTIHLTMRAPESAPDSFDHRAYDGTMHEGKCGKRTVMKAKAALRVVEKGVWTALRDAPEPTTDKYKLPGCLVIDFRLCRCDCGDHLLEKYATLILAQLSNAVNGTYRSPKGKMSVVVRFQKELPRKYFDFWS